METSFEMQGVRRLARASKPAMLAGAITTLFAASSMSSCGNEVEVDEPRPVAQCRGDACSGCEPATCAELAAECGVVDDGCGGTLECGVCPAPATCGGTGAPNQCGCAPLACADRAAHCGTIDDGCGGTVECGACAAPQTCGGGGSANQCGCTPTTCEEADAHCGTLSDGCGGTLTCGECEAPQTCGGGDQPNQCGSNGACEGALVSMRMVPHDHAAAAADDARLAYELVDIDLSVPQVLLEVALDDEAPSLLVVHRDAPEETDNGFRIIAAEVDVQAREAWICTTR